MKLIRALFTCIFPERPTQAVVSSLSHEALGVLVDPVQREEDTVTLLPYRHEAVRACVREAKFHNNERACTLLGNILADYLRELHGDLNAFEECTIVLVPVPLSKKRMKERGSNQVERIARYAVTTLEGVILEKDLVVRTRDTAPQTSLSNSERKRNLDGAFRAQRPSNPDYTYIVLDDVVTTGTTLKAALSVLSNSGMPRVLGLSLAH